MGKYTVSKILATESVHYHIWSATNESVKHLNSTAPHWLRQWEFTKYKKFLACVHPVNAPRSSCLRFKSSTIYSAPPTTCLSCSLLFLYFQLHSHIRGPEQTLKAVCWLLSAHIQTCTTSSFASESFLHQSFILSVQFMHALMDFSIETMTVHELTQGRFNISFKRLLSSIPPILSLIISLYLQRLALRRISSVGFRRACWEVC